MKEVSGNILSVQRGIIVQGCNAQGVMGSGVAKDLRDRYPENYTVYKAAFDRHKQKTGKTLALGRVIWYTVSKEEPKLAIANAITQEFYGRNPNIQYVDYEAVRSAFRQVATEARKHNLPVHYPLIGAGLGGGRWDVIAEIIEAELIEVEHTLWKLPGMALAAQRKPSA